MASPRQRTTSTWFDWAQLVRLPNVFTVLSDVLMGLLFVQGRLPPASVFLLAIGASVSLYWAGMILNDVYDYEKDLRERPQRPLPSQRIARATATKTGYGLLGLGVVLTAVAGVWIVGWNFKPTMFAIGLALSVLLYDRFLKTTPLGPIAMGGCRSLNIAMTFSLANHGHFDASQSIVAVAMGVYVAGVTWFARDEAGINDRRVMVGGLLVVLAGLSLLATFPQYGEFASGRSLTLSESWVWPVLIVLLGCTIVRRCVVAIVTLQPATIGMAVKQCLLSLIVFDAALCLAVRSPVWWALGILALLVPAVTLGKYFYST